MELSDFQRRLLGFPQQAFGSIIADPSATPEQQDMANARMDSLGQMGAILLAAGQRQSPQSRAAIISRLASVDSPDTLAMNSAQRRMYNMRAQQAQAEMQRQSALRQRLSDPAFLQGLGVNPQMAEVMGPDGVADLIQKRAAMNPLDDEVKRAQIDNYRNRPVALSPYEEAKQKAQAEFEMRTTEADKIGLQGDERKEFIATGKVTRGSGAAPTQDQANARTFYGMMETAEKQLSDPKIGPLGASRWERAKDMIWHGATSPEYQLAENAQRNFIAAYLRKTSGQNITESEFAMHRPLFFPQPGETDPRVLAAKAKNRADAMAGILGSAPLDYQREIQQRNAAEAERGSPPPSAGAGAGGSIPQAAIDFLKANPAMRDAFDAKYGPGSAAKVLGQ